MEFIRKIKESNITKRFINAIVFGIGGAAISKGLLMLFNIIVSRMLGETQYGVYSIINNTVQTFTVFAGAGIGVTLTRYVALYRDKDKTMLGIILNTLLVFNAVLSLIVAIIVFIFSDNISNLISGEINISIYIRITSGTIFFTSLMLILQSILQGFEEYKKIAVIQIISNIVMLLIGAIITKFYKIMGTIISLLLLNLVMTIFFAISIINIVKKKNIVLKFKVNETIKEAIKKVAIPAFLASIFVVPLLWVTNFIFTNKNGYEEFAAFSVCLQWFTILNYLPQQLGQVKPIYTQLYAECRLEELKKCVNKMMIFSISFGVIISIILMIISRIILKVYGEFYISYTIPFIIMLGASIFYAIQSQYGSILQAIGKIWGCFMLNMIWGVVFIICFLLLNNKGALGYSLTYLISYFIYSVISYIFFNYIVFKKNIKMGENDSNKNVLYS